MLHNDNALEFGAMIYDADGEKLGVVLESADDGLTIIKLYRSPLHQISTLTKNITIKDDKPCVNFRLV